MPEKECNKTKAICDWALDSRCTVSYNAILYRLRKGWNGEDAIARPRTKAGGGRPKRAGIN